MISEQLETPMRIEELFKESMERYYGWREGKRQEREKVKRRGDKEER